MKRTYQKPTITVVCLHTNTQMLYASNPQTTADPDSAPVDAEEIESRQSTFSMWTDE